MSDFDDVVTALVESYGAGRAQHIGKLHLPSRETIQGAVELAFQIFYPGYHGRQDLTAENVRWHTGALLSTLEEKLGAQITACLCFAAEEDGASVLPCAKRGRAIAAEMIRALPRVRAQLLEDVQAAYDGDPAAAGAAEIILAYPGLVALTVHRLAHELHVRGVPLMPRIMSEWAHARSGADIHPGATIGRRFFIDHATGVVIGETTVIGDDVKLYQGVTLGALSIQKDAHGRVIRSTKRHPTVEDRVTIYANATVLGGQTVIGAGAVVGGSVFLTKSVPPGARVGVKAPELRFLENGAAGDEFLLEFEI